VINNKSQGNVATHLRCGEIFNSCVFFKIIAESASEKTFKIGEHLAKLQQEGGSHVDDREQKQFPVTLMICRCYN